MDNKTVRKNLNAFIDDASFTLDELDNLEMAIKASFIGRDKSDLPNILDWLLTARGSLGIYKDCLQSLESLL